MPPIPRRPLLAGMAASAFAPVARSADGPQPPLQDASGAPLADRLAAYAERLSYRDIDAATLEAVKVLVVDSFGCAIGAFDERPVRVCRELAAAAGAGPS